MKAQGRVRVAGWRPLLVTTSHALVSYELTGQKLDHPFRPYGVPGPELGVWSPEESGVAAPACLGSRTRFGTKTEPTGLAPEDLYVRTQCAPPPTTMYVYTRKNHFVFGSSITCFTRQKDTMQNEQRKIPHHYLERTGRGVSGGLELGSGLGRTQPAR